MPHPLLAAEPTTLTGALQALWYDAHDDWHRAHEAAQAGDDRNSAWVHAYLHRKEGDQWNAAYWYRRAGQPVFEGPLDREWQQIATALYTESL